jgi:hypothetical protein
MFDTAFEQRSVDQLSEEAQYLLQQLRTMVVADDADSADILYLAQRLRATDDRINELLLEG